jgi:hypothetical protein
MAPGGTGAAAGLAVRPAAAVADGELQDLRGPLLTGKIRDVADLCLAPPPSAAVFAVGGKPQVQALERAAPMLPMIPGTPERRGHGHVRHGTTGLFAVLSTATGKVTGKLPARHRAAGFRDFPDRICRYCSRIFGPAH